MIRNSPFRHSGIRSAIRKPFEPSDGYREYVNRSVCELTGLQYGVLSEPVVIPAGVDFKIIIGFYCTDLDGHFFSKESGGYRLAFAAVDNRIALQTSEGVTRFNGLPKLKSVSTYELSRVSGNLELKCDGVPYELEDGSPVGLDNNGTIEIDAPFAAYTGTSIPNGSGAPFGFYCEINGQLVTNLRFDQPETDYQQNYAVPVGDNLAESDPSLMQSGWSYLGDGAYQSNTNEYTSIRWSGGISGRTYLVSCYQYDIIDAGMTVSGPGLADDWTYSSSDGMRFWLVTLSADGVIGFKSDNSGLYKIRDINIREWSGCIMQNTLPEHWFTVQKKRWWDYWLKPNIWDAANVITTGECTAVGNSIDFSMTNTTLAGARLPGIEDGHVYQIAGYSDVVGVITPTQSTGFADNIAVPLEHRFVYDSTGVGLTLGIKRQQGEIVTGQVRDITVREKLEIAS